ncbi:MAG: isoprenylcysteine carboxylmethyltransferase family protein [Bacteroidales bacterium]|nr:isoprenylcysteine carboxylmethyltransferase family protein [Bacteroidales bacterium]
MREILGYAIGFVLFVVLIPVIMWLCSKMPTFSWPHPFLVGIAIICIIDGLTMSIWAIVYMRRVGDGNPMDAFGHEVAPRTKHLMTDGPYRLSRNPMLTGIFVYLIGCCILLGTWQSLVVFLIFVAIMLVQVRTEEERLRHDFGEEYEKYCKKVGRFLPFNINS